MARRRQSVTIKHVAADAGVSLQTVSRVINNEANVRPEMKERVQASIDKLGYVPSIAAQRMSGSRSYIILALNDRERTIEAWNAREGSDWVDQMLMGGMLKCAEHGYRLLFELVDTHDDNIQRELKATIAAIQPDGVILTPPHSDNQLITDLLDKFKIPYARIGSRANGGSISLTMADSRMAATATRYLIDKGHERIAMIAGPEEYAVSNRRKMGWKDAMQEAGLPTEGLCERGDFSFASGERAARSLLQKSSRPTAIIASNDQMAMATNSVAHSLGLRVPGDVSLISFDNSPVVRFIQPALTAIDQPVAETVGRAVELLIAKQRGEELPEMPVVIEGKLIERESVASPAKLRLHG
ncbi:LacI family DNA-binding transcriptional regulator [Aurantiacibacter sediminis]|uniref:LacI family DNA-binding transcriptional regulator n=1 Tax=Aurantiacibacter sediminis TaxID=2793064 RepID=A0ABS0N1C4_9SPHN|nr:LacI family DNA-binding transcriptional regulator [Aurantiacibacter sediminis]MBH5321773.1 LacI family DNA-binding transcriptional regulator [Aurantiacibacter sediminis]